MPNNKIKTRAKNSELRMKRRRHRPKIESFVRQCIWSLKLRMDIVVLSRPWLSTTLSAAILAAIWMASWLVVLMIATYYSSESSGEITAKVFLSGLILSTVAEAVIRRSEQSSTSKRYNLGNIGPMEPDLSLALAGLIFLLGAVGVANIEAFEALPSQEEFLLTVPKKGPGAWGRIITQWYGEFSQCPQMQVWIYIAFVIRVYIYKQKHNTDVWLDTREHILRKKRLYRALYDVKERHMLYLILTLTITFTTLTFIFSSGNTST